MQETKKIYLDYSATTPTAPEVVEAMLPYFGGAFGNPASIHGFGQQAKVGLEDARRQISGVMHAEPGEVVFTSGGTEGNNWAIKGAASFFADKKRHFITSTAEHHAVLYPCQYLEKIGFDVTYLPVDRTGRVSAAQVAAAIRDDTCLVSLMHANNEVGTLNPISEIGAVTREKGVLFHTDAVQTFGKIPIDVKEMNIDLLSISAHKLYGPKGIGALFIRQGLKIDLLLHGGKHERGRRAGTENVPAAVGLGKAAELAADKLEENDAHLTHLRDQLQERIFGGIQGVHLNGHELERHPAILSVSFEGVQSDSLLLSLDLKGIAVSNGSACMSGTVEPSHVLKAMGVPTPLASAAIRFSLGHDTTSADVEYTVEALQEILTRLRKIRRK